jgi:hypothetical protein
MSSATSDAVPRESALRRDLRLWWRDHFTGFSRREAWGYGVWLAFGVLILVPELWAAFWKESAPFPTISATTGDLEARNTQVALLVAGLIVLGVYGSFRYPKTTTGVLPRKRTDGSIVGERVHGDQALPYRTPEGGRLTRSTTPVREISAAAYFICALAVIAVLTTLAVAHYGLDEFAVGRTLYGLIALVWIVIPSLLAWPRRHAIDVPFPTMFATLRSLERRVRVLAFLIVAGMTLLTFHLLLYPWPSIIPDLGRTHRLYACHPLPPKTPPGSVSCTRLDQASARPEPNAP